MLKTAPSLTAALTSRSASEQTTLLAVQIATELSANLRHGIFDLAHELATDPARRRSSSVGRPISSAGRRVQRSGGSSTDIAIHVEAAEALARALLRGPDPASDRMDRLIVLGDVAPAQAVPLILRLATYAIRTDARRLGRATVAPPEDPDLVTASPSQTAALVRLLARRLDESDAQYEVDDDTGMAIAALAVAAPEEFAVEFAPRLISSKLGGGWLIGWDQHLREFPAAARAPFVRALRVEVDATVTSTPVDNVIRFDLDRDVATIALGIDEWAAEVEGWADGDEAMRARAAASIARAWRHPVWPRVVARLLTRGVDARQRCELLYGIEITSYGPDIAERAAKPRLEALDRLAAMSQEPPVTSFVDDARRRVTDEVQRYDDDARRRRRGYGQGGRQSVSGAAPELARYDH
jgi:hypothetical protein